MNYTSSHVSARLLFMLCLLVFALSAMTDSVQAQEKEIVEPDFQAEIDSLKQVFQQVPPGMERYNRLVGAIAPFVNTSVEEYLLRSIIREAEYMHDVDRACAGWTDLARNYCNRGLPVEKIRDCLDRLKQLSPPDQESHRRNITDVESFICSSNIVAMKYETVLDEAKVIFDRAMEENDTYALVTSHEIMGCVLSEVKQYAEAIDSFRKGFDLIKNDEQYDSYNVQLLNEIIHTALDAKDYDTAADMLKELDAYIKRCNRLGGFPFTDRCLWLMEVYYVQLCVARDNLTEAAEHLHRASKYTDVQDQEVECRYNYASALYYQAVGNTHKALEYLNRPDINLSEFNQLKAQLLTAEKRYQEAGVVYEKILTDLHTQYDEQFSNRMREMRTRFDVYQLQLDSQQAQLEVTRLRLNVFTWSLCALSVVAVVLAYLFVRLRRSKRKEAYANRVKTRFLQNMNHEMRTPLNAILGLSTVLSEDESLGAEMHSVLQCIRKNGEQLLSLVSNTMDATMFDTEEMTLAVSEVDLVPICEKVLCWVEPRLESGVEAAFLSGGKPCLIPTNAMWLERLLINLLDNAAKFTAAGRIELAFEKDEARRRVCITVTDTGCSIPPERQEQIFERFVKLDDFVPGAGLGLTVCREIARRLGGSIRVDSTYTTGARLCVELPA